MYFIIYTGKEWWLQGGGKSHGKWEAQVSVSTLVGTLLDPGLSSVRANLNCLKAKKPQRLFQLGLVHLSLNDMVFSHVFLYY